jgi:hypothetical protein
MQAPETTADAPRATLPRFVPALRLNYFGRRSDNHCEPAGVDAGRSPAAPSPPTVAMAAHGAGARGPARNPVVPDEIEVTPMSVEYVKNVMIDGSTNPYPGGAADYESKVRTVLDTIKGTQTGKTVLAFFALRTHRVWIMPPDGLASRRSAGAGAVDSTAAFPRGAELRDIDGSIDPQHRTGAGGGSDSRLHFHPIHWQNGAGGAFTTAEEVVVHELFHAVRQVFGMLRNKPLGSDFLSVEELYSIFVENMYANEKGLALRATHRARSSNVSPDHSMEHNPTFREPMRELFLMMPAIGNALARVTSLYNPFRDWLQFSRAHP